MKRKIAPGEGMRQALMKGLSVGLVRSFTIAISLFALASIVFTGELEPYVLKGTGMFFGGTAILCLFLAFFGKFPAPVATTPIPVALVMVAIADAINLQGQELYYTYVFSIIGCTLLTGVLFWTIGYFRFANFFRFVPFTVSAGALAGSGVLILLMALRLAGIGWGPEFWSSLFDPAVFWKWFLSLALGGLLIAATKLWRRFWVLPAIFGAFCLLFHLGLVLLNVSIEDAIAAGLLVDVDLSGTLWPAYTWDDVGAVNLGVAATQLINGTVLFLVLLVLTVVSFAQLELGAGMELDWNKEFKLHGAANLLSGAGGGIPGAMVASATLPNIALRANTPVTSIVIAVVLVLFVVFGSSLLRLMPMPATSGFLISIALPLISDWLLKSRKRLQIPEYCMLVLICMAIVFIGFLEAIALGLVLSLVFFAVRLSQVRLVEAHFTMAEKRSRTLRSIPDQSIVKVYGPRAHVYRLRGYVFFGSAYSFASQLKQTLGGKLKPVCVIIDFKNVTGFDLSALDSLRGYIQRASRDNLKTILSSTSRRLEQEIQRDFPPSLFKDVTWVDSEEAALAGAEEMLLDYYQEEIGRDPTLKDLVHRSSISQMTKHLDRQIVFEELIYALGDRFETVEYVDQEPITTEGETQRGMQLLLVGKASAKTTDGSILYQCGAGAVIEPVSAVQPRKASLTLVAEGPCSTLLITPEEQAKLDSEDHQLALKLYRYLLSMNTDTPWIPSIRD